MIGREQCGVSGLMEGVWEGVVGRVNLRGGKVVVRALRELG